MSLSPSSLQPNASLQVENSSALEKEKLRGIILYAVCMSVVSLAFFFAHRYYSNKQGRNSGSQNDRLRVLFVFKLCYLATGWFAISVTLSLLNKFFFSFWKGGEYHYPLTLVSMHLTVKFFIASAILLYQGELWNSFPGWQVFFSRLFVVGIMTGLDIGFNNWAVMVSAISLVSTIRSMGIIAVFALSAFMGLLRCSKNLTAVVLVIIAGSVMAIWNEPEFNVFGSMLALGALLSGTCRWVFTQTIMQKHEVGIIATIVFSAPTSIICIVAMAGIFEVSPALRNSPEVFTLIFFSDMALAGVIGGLISFLLLAVEFELIRMSSAMTTEVISKIKTLTLLSMTVVVNGENILPINVLGVITISIGTIFYAKMRLNETKNREEVQYSRVSEREPQMADNDDGKSQVEMT